MQACRPIDPPKKHQDELLRRAVAENPHNHPAGIVEPQRIALLTTKQFKPSRTELTVSFTDGTTPAFRDKILLYANKWQCGIIFRYTNGTGNVRISMGAGGYWSYLGTDILSIPKNRPTMNLEGFTVSTPDSQWDLVVCHEFGHTLGFPHEHSREEIIDRLDSQGCYAHFRRTSGWSRRTVDQQILTVQPESGLTSTDADETSIMAYSFPASCTKSREPIPGGLEINDQDRAFAQEIYSLEVDPEEPGPPDPDPLPDDDEWHLTLDDYEQIEFD